MKWIDVRDKNKTVEFMAEGLKEGTICRTADGRIIMVGEMNTAFGINDEITEEITHYTEDFVPQVESMIRLADNDFENRF